MGLAMLELSLNLPIPLFGTLWVIILAYIASYLPYGMRYAVPGVMQIHSELEDSAYISGASEFRVLIKIVFPLMRRAIFGGILFIFMIAFRELPRALLLQGLHTKLISVTLFELWTDGQLGEVGAFGLVFSVSLGLLGMWARRAFGQSAVPIN
jgi:iron(III) transport system permease protein